MQAALETERLALQARLKDALQVHMAPRTSLDTSSPIDRTVTLLEGLLEVRMPARAGLKLAALRVKQSVKQATPVEEVWELILGV